VNQQRGGVWLYLRVLGDEYHEVPHWFRVWVTFELLWRIQDLQALIEEEELNSVSLFRTHQGWHDPHHEFRMGPTQLVVMDDAFWFSAYGRGHDHHTETHPVYQEEAEDLKRALRGELTTRFVLMNDALFPDLELADEVEAELRGVNEKPKETTEDV
jgi:hypothetical protein